MPELGGIGSSMVLPGPGGPCEILYHHDFFWSRDTNRQRGGWPFLFPICGRLERDGQPELYVHKDQTFRMPIHGFSTRMPWRVVGGSSGELVMALSDTEATRAMYPFQFEVKLAYRAENGALACEQTYSNRGDEPIPYYAGFHPYFLTPAPGAGKESTRANFHPVRLMRYNERLSDVVGEAPPPAVPVSVTDPRVNEMLLELGENKESRLVMPDGLQVHLRADAPFRYLQLYTMPDRPFFCLEPWMSHPNALNAGTARILGPGASESATVRVWTTMDT